MTLIQLNKAINVYDSIYVYDFSAKMFLMIVDLKVLINLIRQSFSSWNREN